jgi:predicted acylesterase/phospholipase RssA
MRRIGLALSGGGFRATLYHLGLVRFLGQAGILPSVSHITSVSGGSILAAHLALHWNRYTGTDHEFESAAREVLDFVRLDVRNRIVRRYPLAIPLRGLQRLALRRPGRQLTRTGLLEYHYERFLFGDTCLFELPEQPQLYVLATNLSEGCLCAFTRDGLLMQRRLSGHRFRFDRVHVGLATVPMAVTASSAFPGFFPPIELTAADLGADEGELSRQSFTDGGVFDNLGVRMFRCLERSWMARELPLRQEEFADVERGVALLQAAAKGDANSAVGWLAQQVDLQCTRQRNGSAQPACPELGDRLVAGVWDLIRTRDLSREPALGGLQPADPDAQILLHLARDERRELDLGEQMWLNRQLVDSAFRQATGAPCFRAPSTCFDNVLVSDAGKPFRTLPQARAASLLGTAMRASDILMDRVWQLEKDTFEDTPGFLFAPITRIVEPADDPTALHPEIQRQAASIRTDLDAFSELEISSLVRHGYCVARQACRSRPDLFGDRLPDGPPWDPIPSSRSEPAHSPLPGAARPAASVTVESRQLQAAAQRRIWSRLLDYRDWTTFLYVPLLVPILVLMPWYLGWLYQQFQIQNRFMEMVAQGSQDYEIMSTLLRKGTPAFWKGEEIEEAPALQQPNYQGFEVLTDSRILDLRAWRTTAAGEPEGNARIYGYRRMHVRKKQAQTGGPFICHVYARSAKLHPRAPDQRLKPVIRMVKDSQRGKQICEMAYDFNKIPVGETVDVVVELVSREGVPLDSNGEESMPFVVEAVTGSASFWIMLPEGQTYRSFDLLRYGSDRPDSIESVEPTHRLLSPAHALIGFSLLSVQPGYTYECRWTYR